MFLHGSNSSSSLYVRAYNDRASVVKSWSAIDGDVSALDSPSQHVIVDFVTRSKSNRSLDEHFAKISGTQFADFSKDEDKIVETELNEDKSFSGGGQECEDADVSSSVHDGNGVAGDVTAPEKLECERNETRLDNFSTNATVKDVSYQNMSVETSGQPFVAKCPDVIQNTTTTVGDVGVFAKEKPMHTDKERPIPTLEPSPRFRGPPSPTSPMEATETLTSSRLRRWQSEDNRFRNVDSAKGGKFVREALVRQKKLEEMREKRLKETNLFQQRGRVGRRARETLDEEDQLEDGDEGGRGGGIGGNIHARQMFRKWKETRSYSLPSELPSDFFKFASRNGDEAEIDDDEDYYHYDGWNRNGNKATAPSKNSKKDNKAKRESNNKRPSGNRAEQRSSTGRRNKSQVSVGTDNNEKISENRLRGRQTSQQQQVPLQQDSMADRRTSFPLTDHQSFQDAPAKDSATFRDQQIGFISNDIGQYRESRSIAPPPRVQQPQTRLTRRYDTRDQGEKNNYEPLKSRRYPWKAAPFDYELKPTRIARERQREFVPQPFRSRSPDLGDESDAAYRVRTPPWGFDKLNPNWEWETGKELRHKFSSQVKMPSVQRRARDIYLVHEDDDGTRAPFREPSRAPPRAHVQAYQNRRVSLNDNNNDNDGNFFNRDDASWRRNIRPGNSTHSAPPPNAGKTIAGQIRQPKPIYRGNAKATQGFTCGCPPRPDPSPLPAASTNSKADVSAALSDAEKDHDNDDDDDDDDDERSVNFGTHANPTSASASPSATSADSRKSQKKDKKDKKKKKKKDKDKDINDKKNKKKDKKKDEKKKKDKKKKDDDSDDESDYEENQVRKLKSKETIVTRRKDRPTSKTTITKSDKKKKDDDSDDDSDYDEKQVRKIKSKETILTRRKAQPSKESIVTRRIDRPTSKTTITKSEEKTVSTPGASLWRSVSNVASIVGLLQHSRVSRDDSGSATYLRLRPKPCPCEVDSHRPPPPPPASRRGVCDGVCARPRLREAREARTDDFDDVRTEYDYLPVITPESTPPWYGRRVRIDRYRRPVPPSPSPQRPTSARRWDRKTTVKDYWDLDVETEPRMRNRRNY